MTFLAFRGTAHASGSGALAAGQGERISPAMPRRERAGAAG
ncbi:MAG: hypothetical protein WAN59_09370 [Candidatus Baltobacteraceae bacterium]